MIRRSIKTTLQHRLAGAAPALVVASYGRSGSTLLHEALVAGMAAHRFGLAARPLRRLCRDYRWTLAQGPLIAGVVYKTHDFPEALAAFGSVRALFVFGSPVDAALSLVSCRDRFDPAWMQRHFAHLGAADSPDALLLRDAPGFRAQITAWAGFAAAPVLCLRYEALWDNVAVMSEFCGFPVTLPARRDRRQATHPPATVAAARAVYGALESEIARLPDCFIAQPDARALLDPPRNLRAAGAR